MVCIMMDEFDPRDEEQFKELPHNMEMEQAFLGSCMTYNNLMDGVIDFLEPEHFANALHQDMYRTCVEMFNHDKPFTSITLKDKYKTHAQLEDRENPSLYFSELAISSTLPKIAKQYAKHIYDLWMRRFLIENNQDATNLAYDLSEGTGADIAENLQQKLSDLSLSLNDGQELSHVTKGMNEAIEMVKQAMDSDKPVTGVTTGIPSFDRATGGLKSGGLYIGAGRPSMGKTALALSMGKAAAEDGTVTAIFSIEMEADELALRVASDMASDDPDSFSYFDAGNGTLSDNQHTAFIKGSNKVRRLPLYISDRGGNTVKSIRTETRRLNRSLASNDVKIGLIIIDYIQLMTMGSGYKGNKVQEIGDISGGLKRLAKELKIPILALSQLSRALEVRDNKRPMLSDLRESGSLEQDADTVFFVYRDWYYLNRQEPKNASEEVDLHDELKRCEDLLEIIIGKQRRGPTKTLRVQCMLPTNTIRDFEAC